MNIRITCSCSTCRTNATKVGAAFPLAADINPKAAAALRITDRNANSAKKTHGLVSLAHHPVLSKAATVREHGPWAVV